MDKNEIADQQPSTSARAPTHNETIESFARANNLSLISIQNMIYHIITDTNLFATLVESNKQALPNLRLTRSKWREIQQKVETNVEITLNPVEAPRTFLDIEYNENDEDEDPEYIPDVYDNDIDFQYFPEDFFEELPPEPVYHSYTDSNYANFVQSIFNENAFELDDDENDEDFHIPSPSNNDVSDPEEEEFINDRTTKISKKEMQDLWKAFDINMDVELERCRSSLNHSSQVKHVKTPLKTFKSVPDNSSSLLGQKPLQFTANQKAMVEEHLAQHLQLLVQSIVGCHGNSDLMSPYNQGILMLNELSTLMDKFDSNSSFKLPNINSALQLVNDFYDEKAEVMNPPTYETTEKDAQLLRVRWALSTCDVILYPELLSATKFSLLREIHAPFLPSERALLALGLIIFKKAPLANANNPYGKYQLISRYFLPNRTSNQIRVHILHTKERYSDNFSKVLTAAFHGSWIVHTELLIKRLKAECTRPVDWPIEIQPSWLKAISKYHQQFCDNGKKFSVFAVKNNTLVEKINPSDEILIVKCAPLPDDYQITDLGIETDNSCMATVTQHQEKNIRSSVDDEVSCQSGKSGGDSNAKVNDPTVEASSRISSKQRRYDNLIKTLNAAENKEKSFYGIVAAIQADINEQFFMHEEKLRQFRKIISSPDKQPGEVMEELKLLLDEKDYELIFLLATLLDPSNFDDKFCDSPEFRAIQSAVEMLKGIQTYLYITRGLKTVRKLGVWFRNQSNEDMEKLQGILKSLFRRDQKIYRLFVADDLEANIPDDRFEVVDLSKASENHERPETFEVVEIPYKRPRYCNERPQPQIHHGSIIFENNGVEKALEIRSSNDRVIGWSASSDLDLLKTLTRFGTDFEKAAEAFCRQPAHANVTAEEAKSRLLYLQSTVLS